MTDVSSISNALVDVTDDVRRTLVAYRRGTSSGGTNPTGDKQTEADERVDDLLLETLGALDSVGTYASEERAEPIDVGDGYGLCIDPLDGSSNLRSNTMTGTIIGLYDAPLPASGRDLVAALFMLFGPVTTMTVAVDGDVTEHTIQDGEIVHSEPISLSDTPEICGFSGRPVEWDDWLRPFANDLRDEYTLRYNGAMVADVQQLLINGGIVGYPRLTSKPDGILRLQYESNPIAYIVESAGGRSSTGSGSVLDAEPEGIHQHVPTYFGNTSLIEDLESRQE